MTIEHVVLGTGAIGRAIADELARSGKAVRLVNRSGVMAEAPKEAEIVTADLSDPKSVRAVTKGAQVVYQCAQPAYHRWPEKFPPLQAAILEGLSGSKAKLVIVENLYMYGATNGTPMTEDMPHRAHTRKGRTRSEMSRSALAAHAAGKVRVAIARGADFFGPWGVNSTMGARVIYPLLQGKPAQAVGRLDLPHTHTYTVDFARAMVTLGEQEKADGQAWHVPNDRPEITQGELIRMLAEAAGVEPRMSAMGRFMMALGGLFIPEARESVEMMYEFEQPFVVDSSKFEKAFGMNATPLREAVEQAMAWYRSHPHNP